MANLLDAIDRLAFATASVYCNMKRSLVIGDIHGGRKALIQVLERASIQPEDELVFLGDYVDGWSESAAVIDFLIRLSQTHSCLFLKGNHDAWCENWLRTGEADNTWLVHGGQETIDSYRSATPETKQQHLQWLEQLPIYHISETHQLFVHAGFTSSHGPQRETPLTNCLVDRTLWEMAVSIDPTLSTDSPFYPKRLKHFREIFIGHTPTTNYHVSTPMHAANVWNVDTGAAFKGRITAMDFRSKQFWQSDPLPDLYPDEKGRNRD